MELSTTMASSRLAVRESEFEKLMTQKAFDQLGELQKSVLQIVWANGGSSVQEVVDALCKRNKKLAYTTVLTTLQNLERAGWVKHKKQGRAYVYSATRSKSSADSGSIRSFIKRAFGGDPQLMFQSLLSDEKLSEDDLIQLRKMIDKKRKELRK